MGKSVLALYNEINALEKQRNTLKTKQKNVKKKIKKTLADEFISYIFKRWQDTCCCTATENEYWKFISTYPNDIVDQLMLTFDEENSNLLEHFQFALDTIIEKAKENNWTFEEYFHDDIDHRRFGVFISF